MVVGCGHRSQVGRHARDQLVQLGAAVRGDSSSSAPKELIAGYSLIQVKTLAEAVEWAKRAPFGLGVQNGEEPEVELRPLFDPMDFEPGRGR